MAELGSVLPERLGLVNLATLEGFKVQFNPENFTEEVSASWNAVAIPGWSYEVLHYGNTSAHGISIALKFLADNTPTLAGLTELKKFLLSLLYPVEDGTSPPDVLFIWPGSVRMVVVVRQVAIANEAFNREGQLTEFTATLTLSERRTYQLTSDDVRRLGSEREDA